MASPLSSSSPSHIEFLELNDILQINTLIYEKHGPYSIPINFKEVNKSRPQQVSKNSLIFNLKMSQQRISSNTPASFITSLSNGSLSVENIIIMQNQYPRHDVLRWSIKNLNQLRESNLRDSIITFEYKSNQKSFIAQYFCLEARLEGLQTQCLLENIKFQKQVQEKLFQMNPQVSNQVLKILAVVSRGENSHSVIFESMNNLQNHYVQFDNQMLRVSLFSTKYEFYNQIYCRFDLDISGYCQFVIEGQKAIFLGWHKKNQKEQTSEGINLDYLILLINLLQLSDSIGQTMIAKIKTLKENIKFETDMIVLINEVIFCINSSSELFSQEKKNKLVHILNQFKCKINKDPLY